MQENTLPAPASQAPLQHAVVIATIGRPALARTVCSVREQSLSPRWLVVRVDGSPQDLKEVERAVQDQLRGHGVHVHIALNDRTPGASGAWNTALDWLARHVTDPDRVVVSFLDDDDWWETDHLTAVDAAMGRGAEIAAAPIVRHDPASPEGRLLRPPAALAQRDFLRGNPGLQGSNLSGRLSTLLEAGMFDEALRSCTDRDIAIRLADLGVRYAALEDGHIHHDARGGERLSTAGSPAKREGLDTFHAKHAWRMSEEDQDVFETRAGALFGWMPAEPPRAPEAVRRTPVSSDRMDWVVASVVDSAQAERVLALAGDLARLAGHPRVSSLSVVFLQNGPAEGMRRIVEGCRALGLDVRAIEEAECLRVGAGLGIPAGELEGYKSIAVARTVLQRVAHEVARERRPVVWVVDDDARLPGDLDLWVDDVARARAAGLDVAIGMVEGAPPVPAATTLRTQLVDLVSFLAGATVRRAEDPMPDAERHNARWQEGRRDYYYDLVRRQTDRLETPFLPRTAAGDLGCAVREVVRRAPRMLAGEQVFRPVAPAPGDPLASAQASSQRGGNTFVFDVELLRDVSNLSPFVEGRRLRRSDMLWATVSRLVRRRDVRLLAVMVRHDRAHEPERGLDPDKLFDDILGYAFARAFEEDLTHNSERIQTGSLELPDTVRAAIVKRAHKLARERLAELRLSCFRIRGLARALSRIAEADARPAGLDDEGAAALARFADRVRESFAAPAFEALKERVERAEKDPGLEEHLRAMVLGDRVARAQAVCERVVGRPVEGVLGHGSEGVVFLSGERAVKVFDRWTDAERGRHVGRLRALRERPAPGALPRVFEVHGGPGPVVVEMERLSGKPYTGGRGPDMVALLRALRQAGLSHENIHPKNLLVTSGGVRLVDVGRSIVPCSPDAEEHAARRALLSMRCAGEAALADHMRRSITDSTLPELAGREHLLRAVRGEDEKRALDRAVAEVVSRRPCSSLVDFGCGKPRGGWASLGEVPVTAFDPDGALSARWAAEAPQVRFLDETGLLRELEAGQRFGVVVCSLVLCAIEDAAMAAALRRIRRLVEDGGRAVIAVCDPRSVAVAHTARHHRILPGDAAEDRVFAYTKQVLGAGARVEHHRPMAAYRSAFFDAGLEILEETTVTGVDTETLRPVSEFAVFELSPRRATGGGEVVHREHPTAGLTVLSYHRVPPAGSLDPAVPLHERRGMVVRAATFEAHVRDVARRLTPVGAREVVDALTGRRPLPRGAVWLTFDDGYREGLESVVPVLSREGVPATFFVRTPRAGGAPSWAPLDLCYQVLARGVGDMTNRIPVGEERARLLARPHAEQIRWVTALAAELGVEAGALRPEDLYLSETECGQIHAAGFSLGAHGADHVPWPHLDGETLAGELSAAAAWLDRVAPGGALTLAYPDAAVDPRVAEATARAGFGAGVVLEIPAPGGVDPRYAIRRRIARDDPRWIDSLAEELRTT